MEIRPFLDVKPHRPGTSGVPTAARCVRAVDGASVAVGEEVGFGLDDAGGLMVRYRGSYVADVAVGEWSWFSATDRGIVLQLRLGDGWVRDATASGTSSSVTASWPGGGADGSFVAVRGDERLESLNAANPPRRAWPHTTAAEVAWSIVRHPPLKRDPEAVARETADRARRCPALHGARVQAARTMLSTPHISSLQRGLTALRGEVQRRTAAAAGNTDDSRDQLDLIQCLAESGAGAQALLEGAYRNRGAAIDSEFAGFDDPTTNAMRRALGAAACVDELHLLLGDAVTGSWADYVAAEDDWIEIGCE
jgi:hypothetical protein